MSSYCRPIHFVIPKLLVVKNRLGLGLPIGRERAVALDVVVDVVVAKHRPGVGLWTDRELLDGCCFEPTALSLFQA